MSRSHFLAQLPPRLRIGIAEDVPDEITLEGETFRPEPNLFLKKYPGAGKIFAPIELRYMREMFNKEEGVSRVDLQKHNRPGGNTDIITSNVVDVHIKNMRKKIRNLVLPFEIVTKKSGHSRYDGGYILREI